MCLDHVKVDHLADPVRWVFLIDIVVALVDVGRWTMDEVKVTITTAIKGMRESLDKAETNIANLIKEVSMLATASPYERLFPLVQMIQKRPNIAGKITGMILVMDNSSNKSRPLWMSWPNTNNL